MRPALACVSLLVVLLASAPAADAYDIAGSPWPDNKITYWVAAPEFKSEVLYAARKWNKANVGIVFRAARTRDSADFVVKRWDRRCGGAAITGFYGVRYQSQVLLGQGCGNNRLVSLVATHEFGHVLGLGHENGTCALMNTSFDRTGSPNQCTQRPLDYWFSRPLRSDDIRGAKSLYR